MAAVTPDPKRIRAFPTVQAFEQWLRAHHDREPEIWLKIHKKASGLPSITWDEAVDVVLCWGWIDGIRKSFDEQSFLQRYTPRGPRSSWSQINRDRVARLSVAGRMTPHGQKHIDAARADGRWEAAYAPIRAASRETLPADLRAAIDASPKARKFLPMLNRQNLFALTYRTNNMKTAEGRARKIESLVAMLERGETISPQTIAKPSKTPARRKVATAARAKKK